MPDLLRDGIFGGKTTDPPRFSCQKHSRVQHGFGTICLTSLAAIESEQMFLLQVKVSDFGLSRALSAGKDYYQTDLRPNLRLPIAWLET